MKRWLVLVGVWCLILAGCAASDDQADQDDAPPVSEAGEVDDAGRVARTPRPHLACLPLDERGWSRSEEMTGVMALPVSLAANDEAVVVVGRGPYRDIVAFHASDGVDWEEGEGFPAVTDWGSGVYVAGAPQGFVSVATLDGDTPVVAFSPDGSNWEHLDPSALPENEVAWLSGVFAGPDGFIIVGVHDRPDLDVLVWHSSDGRRWTATDFAVASGVAIAPTPEGWVAVTARHLETDERRVWASSDGIEWRETATESTPPDHVLSSYIGHPSLTVHDGTWVLATRGGSGGDPWPHYPTVWVSTDDGQNWNEQTVWSDGEATGFQTDAAASTEYGLILAGAQDLEGEQGEYFLHHSEDGMTWEPCWTTPLAFTELVPFGDAIVAFDAEFGDLLVWNEPL